MLSTPDPIPISITPAFIFEAIVAQAYNPDEQSLLTVIIDVVSGNPARNIPILLVICPAPGCKVFPTQISSTSFGSTLALWQTSRSTTDNKY